MMNCRGSVPLPSGAIDPVHVPVTSAAITHTELNRIAIEMSGNRSMPTLLCFAYYARKRNRFTLASRLSGPIRLASDPLNRNVLCGEHFALQRIHACSGFIDSAREGDRSLEDRLQPFAVLDACARIFMLDDQESVRRIQWQQFPRGKLVIQPIDR